MKIFMLFALVALAVAVDYYPISGDSLDVGELLADRDKMKQFLDCFMDRGPCSELAARHKILIPEVVEQACRKCNDYQKHSCWQFIKGLKVIFPDEYRSFRQKYDPEDKYFEALEKEISQY